MTRPLTAARLLGLSCLALALLASSPPRGAGAGRTPGGAGRARGLAQEGPRATRDRQRGRAAPPAGAMDRVLGADQPPERRAGRRARNLLCALARHLCRGPSAQRLAARTGQAARLGQLQPRLPALSHERRPRGHLLLAADAAPERPGRARCRAQRMVCAARSGRRLQPARQHAARGRAADGQRCLAGSTHLGREQPAARGTCRRRLRQPGSRHHGGRAVGEPGALPVAQALPARTRPNWPRWRCCGWPAATRRLRRRS